ncbi:gamma-glutamylcyclotransferase family protein [Cyclobacterium jeungdonense]|uniref:Gamma-glutamylcyclotransferase family protein n=1 Tax=Cyclobacterium jeungdonense TaxID=708087 RepID=A0ABT8C5U4_9BACT|nr:gamma-glutamylcyclotransferase family protein [Cyclobacterium jeungdonense]MDN3688149.1 gamma-glutamylcyclotransferase family protein [Cyclobacterium jeungdonense]
MAAPATLFVYGTLRKGFDHPMSKILADSAKYIGKGTFQGLLFDRGPYPAAVVSYDKHCRVHGDVYELQEAKKVLQIMDEYEAAGELLETGVTFERKQVEIRMEDGSRRMAWVYLHSGYTDHFIPIEGGDYLRFKKP